MDFADGGASGGMGVARPLLNISLEHEESMIYLDSIDDSEEFRVGPPLTATVRGSRPRFLILSELNALVAFGRKRSPWTPVECEAAAEVMIIYVIWLEMCAHDNRESLR